MKPQKLRKFLGLHFLRKRRENEVTQRNEKILSEAVDKKLSEHPTSDPVPLAQRAHLNLTSDSGAAQLNSTPALFVAMLCRWLRVPFSDTGVLCPCCDGVLDSFGDHALDYCSGGDRTRRHNLLRVIAFFTANAANLHPELEKPVLLPQRLLLVSASESGRAVAAEDSIPSARRPANVYIAA